MMKIAVPVTDNNQIEGHIGQCESYNIFTVSDKKEIEGIAKMKSPGGCGCNTDIANVLASDGVEVLLAAGIGGGSTKSFNKSGINVIRGCSGDATEVVKLYLSGLVEDKGSSCNKHHPQHEHHHHHEHHHASHHVVEIAGMSKDSHQCGCNSGEGNQCNHN
jgi:predicted Fe-Mo cluster-binding NifX family protein